MAVSVNERQPKSGTKPRGTRKNKRRGRRQIVLPGRYIFGSVRILHRRYLLRPCRETNEAFKYLLAYCAQKWNVDVFTVCVVSNHYHTVIRDNDGVHPHFFRDLNRMLAQFLKAKYQWSGQVFRNKPSRVVCIHPSAVVDKIAYTLANPVSAGAVRLPHEWPGFRTRIDDMGRTTFVAKRPSHFFGRRATLPKELTLNVGFPPCLDEHYESRGEAVQALRDRLEHHTQKAHAEIRHKNWRFLGAERAQKISAFKRARSWEVFDTLNPAFATLGLSPEETAQVKRNYIAWQLAYEDCRERWLAGETNVLWPPGTWAMVQFFGQKTRPVALAA